MLDLFFNYNADRKFPRQLPSSMDYILRTYQRDVTEVVLYYRRGIRAVDHRHQLCRLISTIGAPTQYEVSTYLNVVEARGMQVSKTMGFTSAINYGTIHYGIFGAPDDPEIIICTEEPFNTVFDYSLNDRWKSIQSVKCIEHQNSTMTPLLLNGRRNNSSVGLRVYQVDIRKLMLQYKYFTEHQIRKSVLSGNTDTSILDKTHFVAKYVLPNMMYSDMNLQFMNRLQNIVSGRPMDKAHFKLPIPYIDYTEKVDNAFKQIQEYLFNQRRSYEGYLRAIPSLFKEDAQQALLLPSLPPMRQLNWAIIASRVKQIRFLLTVGGEEGRKANRSFINSIRLDLKHALNDKQFTSVLDKYYSSMNLETIYEELKRDINYIGVAR